MDVFWKLSAGVLIALVLILTLQKQAQDMGVLLTIAVCCMTSIAAVQILEPVLDFLLEIQIYANMDSGILRSVLQMVGVGLTAELIALICSDAGCSSLGKNIQILGSSVILYLSIPIFENMIELIQRIMFGL